MIINRSWAMPSHDTCSIKPIKELVEKYEILSLMSLDPFARDSDICTATNDLNPGTKAMYHLKAEDFLKLPEFNGADFVLFDPPYSLRQVKECYESFGYGFTHKDSQNAIRWTTERDIISSIQPIGGVCISMGWTSTCMGKKRGYEIKEILLCSHGPAHNDTIVTVEIKMTTPPNKQRSE